MDLDSITLVLIIIIVGYLAFSRIKMYLAYKKGLETVKERKAMQEVFTGHFNIVIYSMIIIASAAGLVYIYFNQSKIDDVFSWALLTVVIIITALVDMIRIKVMYTAHYNDHGMYVNEEYIRFNSIKEVSQKGMSLTSTVTTFNNHNYIVPIKTLKILEKKIKAKNPSLSLDFK